MKRSQTNLGIRAIFVCKKYNDQFEFLETWYIQTCPSCKGGPKCINLMRVIATRIQVHWIRLLNTLSWINYAIEVYVCYESSGTDPHVDMWCADTGYPRISWFHNSWSPLFRDSVLHDFTGSDVPSIISFLIKSCKILCKNPFN